MLADINMDRIDELTQAIEAVELDNVKEVEAFVRNYTTLIWDFKMIGKIYDYYLPDIEVIREDRILIQGVDQVIEDVTKLLAAFPDMRVDIENVIVSGTQEDGYKVFRRMRYKGTNKGYSQFGPPTGKSLGNNCLALSMFYLKKIDGTWKITNEMDMRSTEWIEEILQA
jgi:predicted ester cyclase